jgi:hypothetical protein
VIHTSNVYDAQRALYERRRLAVLSNIISAIGQQPAFACENRRVVNGGYPVMSRQRYNLTAVVDRDRIRQHDHSAAKHIGEVVNDMLDVVCIARPAAMTCTPIDGAAVSMFANSTFCVLHRIVEDCNAADRGATCLNGSNDLPPTAYSIAANPLTLPPGRAKVTAMLLATGSVTCTKTIGTIAVICR